MPLVVQCLALLICSLLYTSEGISAGCDVWRLSGNKNVCCQKCKPGNRLVTSCGPDPSKLCTPCDHHSYIIDPNLRYCSRCTECTEPQFEVQACSATSDTKCGCKQGLRCGNEQCSFCVDECGKGQEPTHQRTCHKCPEGKFNDQIHSACKPWTKSCPEGQILVAKGDAFSDIKCSRVSQISNTLPPWLPHPKTKKPVKPSSERINTTNESTWLLVIGGICTLFVVFSLSMVVVSIRNKNKTETKEPIKEAFPQGELTVMMVEHEESCSFHQPEQEQGGSSESICTQDSESKLIV